MDSHYQLKMSLIYAENCERVGIRGDGEINGRGVPANFPGGQSNGTLPGRPVFDSLCRMQKGRHGREFA